MIPLVSAHLDRLEIILWGRTGTNPKIILGGSEGESRKSYSLDIVNFTLHYSEGIYILFKSQG